MSVRLGIENTKAMVFQAGSGTARNWTTPNLLKSLLALMTQLSELTCRQPHCSADQLQQCELDILWGERSWSSL